MKTHGSIRWFAAAAVLAVGLAACSGDAGDEPTADSGGEAAPTETQEPDDAGSTEAAPPSEEPAELQNIRFTVFPGALASMGVYVADALGFFEDEGLAVEYVSAGTGSSAMSVLLTGDTDFTISDITGTAGARQAGGDPVFVSSQFHRFGGALVCRPDVELSTTDYPDSMKELEGKTIGITAPGSATDTYTRYSMIAAGADPANSELIPIGGAPQLLAAWEAKSVDCLTAYQPMQYLLEDYQAVADWEAGEGPEEFDNYVFNGIVTSESFDAANADVVAAVRRAMEGALAYASDAGNAAEIASETIGFFEGLDEETLAQIVEDGAGTFGFEFTEDRVNNAGIVYKAVTGEELPSTYEELLAPSLR